jgi:PAS domain S-box-containing protein
LDNATEQHELIHRVSGSIAGAGVPGAVSQVNSELYRILVETVRDYAIFALDPTGHVLTWNAGAARIKGYAAHEIIGRHFSAFYPEEDILAGKPPRELEIAIATGQYEEEGWRLRKDGTRFWAHVLITTLWDDQHKLLGFAKVTRDLTERRKAEQALRASEHRFRLLVQSVKDYGIYMLDPHGHVTSWNEGAERISGYQVHEILGKHFSIFYPPEDLATEKPAMELREAERLGRYEDEGWRLRRDGTRYWTNVVITALRESNGQLVAFSKVTRDLTERRLAEQRALEDARRVAEMEASNRTKTEFLATMSHELRTPLNAIAGYVDLLTMGVRGPVSEQQKEDLERIRRSQQHLLGIINDLLNYSRVEAGRVTYQIERVDVAQIIDSVLTMVEPQATSKGLNLAVPVCGTDASVLADSSKLQQIILNLLSNAVKFTPSGGSITITCSSDNHRAHISVSDTGPGIPASAQDAVFEPFVQLGRSLSSGHEGAGLGLAISRDLARAMGGDLTLDSTEGQGSTFTVSLPTV